MNKTILVMLAAGFLALAFLPSANAQFVEAGLSGQCYNAAADKGGQDEVRVGDGGVVVLSGTDPADPTAEPGGVVPALVLFGTETVNDGGNPGMACKRYDCFTQAQCNGRDLRFDYLEVDATLGGIFVQFCYNGGVDLSGTCPTSPTGPGN